MLGNLKAEMARINITTADIAVVIKKSDRTVRDRIKGKGQFSVPDATAVRDTFFPELTLEYLFTRTPEVMRDSA